MVSQRLRFVLHSTGGCKAVREIESHFRPHNQTLLNRTRWRGKEPRSCAVTSFKPRLQSSSDGPVSVDIEVTHRPQGDISYHDTTKFDGWTELVLNRSPDGILLDRNGQPLKDGDRPVEIPHEVFEDVEFNDLDFGELVQELDIQEVKFVTLDEVIDEITSSGLWNVQSCGEIVAPHRKRSFKRIVLSNSPTEQSVNEFGIQTLNINTSTPHLEHVLMEQIFQLIREFLEGTLSLKNYGNKEVTYVEFADSVVHCEPNDHRFSSWMDTLHWYTPQSFLEDLAKRLMAVFSIEVAVIDGKKGGLVLRSARE